MSDELIPFGKYKGQPIEAMAEDQKYIDWLMAQSWFKSQYGNIYKIVINNFCEPSDTPEHNAMQVKFLDADYAAKVAIVASSKIREEVEITTEVVKVKAEEIAAQSIHKIKSHRIDDRTRPEWYRADHHWWEISVSGSTLEINLCRTGEEKSGFRTNADWTPYNQSTCVVQFSLAGSAITSPDILEREFENGCDVRYVILWGFYEQRHATLAVEIKPSVGDDFPSVLREIRRQKANVLLLAQYAGTGATKEEFVALFESQGIRVVFTDQVDAVDLKKTSVGKSDFLNVIARKIISFAANSGVKIVPSVPGLSPGKRDS